MADIHIKQLRTTLESNHWIILGERLVDEYSVSAYWDIARPDKSNQLTICFDGGYDVLGINKRTFNKTAGCWLLEHKNVNLYFARVNRSWASELDCFIRELNKLG